MRKALIAISILTLMSVSCSAPSGASLSRCPEISFMKSSMDENGLLGDLRQLVDTPGVGVLADYSDGRSFYLTVAITNGHDLDVREKVTGLGWQPVDSIPSSAKPRSRVFGNRWNL